MAKPHLAVVVSTGPLALPSVVTERKVSSMATFLLSPLREVARVDAFVCVDDAQPTWQTNLLREYLRPLKLWHFEACNGLSGMPLQCCMGGRDPICDASEMADGAESNNVRQFFRLNECYRRIVDASVSTGHVHDFYVRVRPDLHWIGAFDTRSLSAPGARRGIGVRYRSAAGLEGLTLGHFQMAWYKVGPDACGEARWQTDYPCATLDDQFALVPTRLAPTYFGFALRRLSQEYRALWQHSPAVPPCSCWHCMEGRLTEYLTLHGMRIRPLSLPATYVYDPPQAAPMLLPETAGTSGEPDAVWSPSTRIHCALRNGSWGVAAWLVRSGLLRASTGEPSSALVSRINSAYSMKGLWQEESEWHALMGLLQQQRAAERRAESATAPRGPRGAASNGTAMAFERAARDALHAYALRFLVRAEAHKRCEEPSAARRVGCAPARRDGSTNGGRGSTRRLSMAEPSAEPSHSSATQSSAKPGAAGEATESTVRLHRLRGRRRRA